jgi:hypothetical protein
MCHKLRKLLNLTINIALGYLVYDLSRVLSRVGLYILYFLFLTCTPLVF